MTVVLDTNVLLVSLPSRSPFHAIYRAIVDGRLTICVTNETLTEYEEQISTRLGIHRSEVQLREILNLPNVLLIDVYYNWQLIEADKDDNKFVDCAIAGSADYLVTNDRHYNILNNVDFPKVTVIKAEDFLKLLVENDE
ncbi:putative toxin-antitoxin system toxin component, PIN family [Fibrisoma montanum]|uniref:Putative toxin-antitoxin system toxin component, PIN family n=1 Tax=Fibrisoma montanum TaxID=2305895 RepID=A0A418M312_9BACT|nr:putative toxin-antitoxin system toxin component, PIN family [Fibrisoma montanum]RIV20066.1 putative toxin-antitoxin system toxin component, PIN family [Fibrisoma montanum]